MRGEVHRKLGYADYAAIPDDGKRYEVLDGALYLTPAPNPLHQRASKRLQRQLEAYFEERSLGEVFNAPIDVILSPHDILQPDLVVVAQPTQISKRAIEGAPLLVVEILSPSTKERDRVRKRCRYAATGVRHFWILDPDSRTLECFRLQGEIYETVVTFDASARVAHPEWPELVLDLPALWR